jgi:hypothetical protein
LNLPSNIKLGLFILLNISVSLVCFANVDPFALMEEMPSPQVKFKKKRIFSKPRQIKKPNFVPDFKQQSQAKETVKSIKKDFEKITPKTINKIYKSLSKPLVKKASGSLKLTASATKKLKRPRMVIKKTDDLSNSVAELKKFINLEKIWADLPNNLAKAQTQFAKQEEARKAKEQKNKDAAAKQDEEPKKVKGADALFVKIKKLKKKEKWKDIKKLLSKNKEIAATKKGLEYQIEAELNSKKVSYSRAKSAASKLLKQDKKSPWGNYAMALYYHNARKPKPKRVTKYLNLALKAKNPPPGASTLYWTIFLKKIWFIPVLLIAGIIGGINHLKKKKAAATGEMPEQENEQQAETETPIEPEVRPEGWKGKLFDIKQKAKPFIDKLVQKFKKSKKAAKPTEGKEEASAEPSAESTPEAAAEIQTNEAPQTQADTAAVEPEKNEESTEESQEAKPEEKTA